MTESAVSDYLLLTHEDFVDSPLVPVTTAQMLQEQQNDPVCRHLVARLEQAERETFSLSKERLSCRTTHGDEQIGVPKAVQTSVL